jgi:hypothetical protein
MTDTYKLPGGTEENDLPFYRSDGVVLSEWELTLQERAAIAQGAHISLAIYHEPIPPVSLAVIIPDIEEPRTPTLEEMEAGK